MLVPAVPLLSGASCRFLAGASIAASTLDDKRPSVPLTPARPLNRRHGGNCMRNWLKAALAGALATLAAPALAAYPERPVTVVVPFAAGGATDVIARIYADHMSRTLGQQLVI